MSAFGMSSAGKNASGTMNELPQWFLAQMKQALNQSDGDMAVGNHFQKVIGDLLTGKLANGNDGGLPSPAEIRDMGMKLMPSAYETGGIQTGDQVADEMSGVLGDLVGNINAEKTVNDLEASGKYKTGLKRNDDSHDDITAAIAKAFGGSRAALSKTGGDNDAIFQRGLTDAELMKPGGTARAARVARSANPLINALASRLQRGGVSVSSPEYATAMAGAEADRATLMDNSLAEDTDRYIGARANIGEQQVADKNRRLSTEIDLNTAEGGATITEAQRRLATALGLDEAQMRQIIANTTRQGDRTSEAYGIKMSIPGLRRDMNAEDYNRKVNADQMVASAGTSNVQANRSAQDNFLTQLQNFMQGNKNSSVVQDQLGGNFGSTAFNQSGQVFDKESAGANWLGKSLLGIGTSLASGALSGITGGATGGTGGGIAGKIGGLLKKTKTPTDPYGPIQM